MRKARDQRNNDKHLLEAPKYHVVGLKWRRCYFFLLQGGDRDDDVTDPHLFLSFFR